MEIPGKNQEKNIVAAENKALLIEAAKNEMLRLRDLTRMAAAAGKTQKEEGLLQYAKDFENIDLSLIGGDEANLLDKVMHASGDRAYEEFVKDARKYLEEKVRSFPKESRERKSLLSFYNYIANCGSAIANRKE